MNLVIPHYDTSRILARYTWLDNDTFKTVQLGCRIGYCGNYYGDLMKATCNKQMTTMNNTPHREDMLVTH